MGFVEVVAGTGLEVGIVAEFAEVAVEVEFVWLCLMVALVKLEPEEVDKLD